MKNEATGKVDFHLHSYASNVTNYYAANIFSIPESYSDPKELYRLLKARGMTLVTLTDHNSIDGVKELLDAGLPDVFISAEMTTTFPEDGCNIHVTVANMTEAQFAEIHRLRRNVYEMVAYVDAQIAEERERGAENLLAYFMTHPLMSTENRPYGREGSLSIEHLEKALLLFSCFEVQNGTRTRALNDLTRRLVESLDPATIERLANRHDLPPKGETPWLKGFVGGSDDHAGINPGRTWTEFPRGAANALVLSIRRRETRPAGAHGGPITLAHSLLKLLYDGQSARNRAAGVKTVSVKGPIHSVLRRVFDADSERLHEKLAFQIRAELHRLFRRRRGAGISFDDLFTSEVYALLSDGSFRRELAALQRTDDRTFAVVSRLINRIFARYVESLKGNGSLNLVRAIKEVVALVSSNVFVSLPYLISYFQQSSDSRISRDLRKAFALPEKPKLVLVTDTFFEVNGVARTIRRILEESRRRGVDLTVVTCLGPEEHDAHCANPEVEALIREGRLKIFAPIAAFDLPQYPELKLRFPPFLELLQYLQESGFTKMHISTPGTVGIAGLLAAKTLLLETAATYHTSLPEYVENYTRDLTLEALTWKYMLLFYHSVDEVLVPSKFIAKLLHKRGLRNRKLLILDRWVDLERFHPRQRTAGYWRRFGIENEESLVKFVYLGRLGVEKNLGALAEAYRKLRESRPDAHLILIGDGPYRGELERQLAGVPATFAGLLEGAELARAVASADAKIFPSTTDTWGNAALEAQASGLPVVVSDVGGPCELMRDGITGFRVSGRDPGALLEAMTALMDSETRARMGRNARAFIEANRVDEPFSAVLDSESYRRRLEQDGAEVLDLASLALEIDGDRAPVAAKG
jgi:glycosyltransferase involved in cell wall biosynthesis